MFENHAKGWYGSYSKVGRSSAEKYFVITHKDDILNGETKKIKIKDIFSPDEEKEENCIEDNIDVYQIYNSKFNNTNCVLKPKKKNILTYSAKKRFKNKSIENKYDDLHQRARMKIKITDPSCTKYYPKFDYIFPKLLSGPEWDYVPGRELPIQGMIKQENYTEENMDANSAGKKKDVYNPNTEKENIIKRKIGKKFNIVDNGESKCLVNMNKTTRRGDFLDAVDLRIRTDKPYFRHNIPKRNSIFNNLNGNYKEMVINTLPNKKHKTCLTDRSLTKKSILSSKKNSSKVNSINNYQSSSTSYKNLKISNKKKKSTSCLATEYSKCVSHPPPSRNNAINFSKTISREQREKVKGVKLNNVSYISPNYSLVRERSISMAVYEKENPKKKKQKRLIGLDPSVTFDPDKIIDKYNNHTIHKAPKFDYMTSRPYKKGSPLPSFMQKIFGRCSMEVISDKTLKLNRYSEGKFIIPPDSFFPKRSYNNIINLCLLKSKDKKMDNLTEESKERLISQMNFKHKRFEAMIKEGALDKFDKITLKTIEKKKVNPDPFKMKEFLGS